MEKEDRKLKTRIDKDRDSKKVVESRGAGLRQEQRQRGSGYGPLFTSSLGNSGLGLFFNGLMVQAKLKVGRANDRYEREADRVADELVTRDSSTPGLQTNVSKVQAKGSPSGKSMTGTAESQVKSMPGGGRSLDKETRAYFEPRFGVDLGSVKVHTDKKADNMAKTLNARALTYGNNIAFAGGQYRPNTLEGKKLIAHELTHVLQQSGETVQRSTDKGEEQKIPDEREVDRFPQGFDPAKEARKLHKALGDGWGSDPETVIDILTTGREDMVRAIEVAYNIDHKIPLRDKVREQLWGYNLKKVNRLLENGKLSLIDKVREVLRNFFMRGRLNTEKLYHDLLKSTIAERAELVNDKKVCIGMATLLPGDEWEYIQPFLFGGQGILAAQLLSAVDGWGTDEELIWRSVAQANKAERDFILSKQKLLKRAKSDLSAGDYLRLIKLLEGNFTSLDKVHIAAMGWGTDETQLLGALRAMTEQELKDLNSGKLESIKSIDELNELLESELSGANLEEAKQLVHQKRMAFDQKYKEDYLAGMPKNENEETPDDSSALFPQSKEDCLSPIDELKIAAAGAGTKEKTIWHVLNSLNSAQRKYLLKNPEGILGVLYNDLSEEDFKKALIIMHGGVKSVIATLREAMGFWNDDERLIYDTIDRIINEGLSANILNDEQLMDMLKSNLNSEHFKIFETALKNNDFLPMERLRWATTAVKGTDEELVYELCAQYKDKESWHKNEDVEKILESELETRDYWQALDILRPEPKSEEERIAFAQEKLNRERGGFSEFLMDQFSDSGENAEAALVDYRVGYNQAIEDGKMTAEEEKQIRKDEEYSHAMTANYQAAKSTIANWASSIAVAIVGTVVTILTAGTAGPFIAVLGAHLLEVAGAMVAAAALKVGINKAIQGEGYDVQSTTALIDGISASLEIGLTVLGGNVASQFTKAAGKTKIISTLTSSVQNNFGKAGPLLSKVLKVGGSGVENAIDATIGGVGEGVLRTMADEKTWSSDVGGFFQNLGSHVELNAKLSAVGGFIGGAGIRSISESVGFSRIQKYMAEQSEGLSKSPGKSITEPEIKANNSPDRARFETDRSGNTLDRQAKEIPDNSKKVKNETIPEEGARFAADSKGNIIELPQKSPAVDLEGITMDIKSIKSAVEKRINRYINEFGAEIEGVMVDVEKVVLQISEELDALAKQSKKLTIEEVENCIESITSKEFHDSISILTTTGSKVGIYDQHMTTPPKTGGPDVKASAVKQNALSPHEAVFLKNQVALNKFGSYDSFLNAMKRLGSEDQLIDMVNKLHPLSTNSKLGKFDNFSLIVKNLGGLEGFAGMTYRLKGIDNVVTVIDSFGGIAGYGRYLKRGGSLDSVVELLTKLDSFEQIKRLLSAENDFSKVTKFIDANVGEGKISHINELLELLDEFDSLSNLNSAINAVQGLDNFVPVKAQFDKIGLSLSAVIKKDLAPALNRLGLKTFSEAASIIGLNNLRQIINEVPVGTCKIVIDRIGCGNFHSIMRTVGPRDFSTIFNRMGADTFLKNISKNADSVGNFIKAVKHLGPEGYLRNTAVRELRDIPGFNEAVEKAGGISNFIETIDTIGGISDFSRAARKNGRIDADFIRLMTNVAEDAHAKISNPGEHNLKDLLATAQAGAPGIKLNEKIFQNIPVKPDEFGKGIQSMSEKGMFKIDSPQQFLTTMDSLYQKHSGNRLHPEIRARLKSYIGSGDKLFTTKDGVPGLHAEVLAVNDVLHQLSKRKIKMNIKDIRVATFKLAYEGQGQSFKACNNCGNILEYFTILTGRVNK